MPSESDSSSEPIASQEAKKTDQQTGECIKDRTVIEDFRESIEISHFMTRLSLVAWHKKDATSDLMIESLTEYAKARLPRIVPVRIYLSNASPKQIQEVTEAVRSLCKTLELVIVADPPGVSGSWWKSFVMLTRNFVTLSEVQKRLQKAERAIEMAVLHQQQSESDKNQADAVSKMIKALENVQYAALQIGSILVIKRTDKTGGIEIVSRTLTQAEMILIENNPDVLRSPEQIIDVLRGGTVKVQSQTKRSKKKIAPLNEQAKQLPPKIQ